MNNSRFFIGLDLGTSAVKGVLLSEYGEVVKTENVGFSYYTEGEAKLLSPTVFLDACFKAISSLSAAAPASESIVGICASGAAGSMIMLDESDEPLIPIIGWQTNVKIEDAAEFYTDEEKKALRHIIGWPIGRGFPGIYIPAIRKYRPDIFERARKIAMTAEYLNFSLSGKWGISHSMATPFDLADQVKGEYNKPLLSKLGVSEDLLPPIMNKTTSIGFVKPDIAKELGVSPECCVCLGSFDHPAGAVGAGVFEEGELLLSLGTSWVEFFPIEKRSVAEGKPLLIDRFMLKGAPYCVMKSIAGISEKINSLRRELFGNISYEEFDALASLSSPGSDGVAFDFTENDKATAVGKEPCHLARAITESAARKLSDNLAIMEELGFRANKITMIGGITNSAVSSKIIAETLGREITVVNGEAAGAIGSAILASIGVGVYSGEKEAFEKMNFTKTVYTP